MKTITKIITVLIAAIIVTAGTATDTGKAGKTGSPGETTCVSCHNNTALNTGPGSLTITSNIPNWKYAVGTTYQITVTVTEPSRLLFGFGCEILRTGNVNAGNIIITNTAEQQILAFSGKANAVHKKDGGVVTTPGSKSFTFNWKAPSADSGDVTIYASGIAGINDADETNDNTYSATHIIYSPSSTVGIQNLAAEVNFSVYPNPVKDQLNVSFYNAEAGMTKATLYSINGQKIADLFNEFMPQGAIGKHIPISDNWAKGIYLLKLEKNEGMATQKIIIE